MATRSICISHEKDIKNQYVYKQKIGEVVETVELRGCHAIEIRETERGPLDVVLSSKSEARVFDSCDGGAGKYVGKRALEGHTIEVYRKLNPEGVQKILGTLGFTGTLKEFLELGNRRTINYRTDRAKVRGKMLK